jgi:hypothetical protein
LAGSKPVELKNVFPRTQYVDWLSAKLQDSRIDILTRYRAFGYRLFKEYVNLGDYEKAALLLEGLREAYLALGFDLFLPGKVVEAYSISAGESQRLPSPKFYPYNMPIILYLIGTLQVAYNHDRVSALPFFDSAIALSDLYRNVFSHGIFQVYDLEIQSVKDWSLSAKRIHNL